MSTWQERSGPALDELVESPLLRRASAANRRGSRLVQTLLDDEEAKPKVQEFIRELEGNGTIEVLEDLLSSWYDLRAGFVNHNGKNRDRAGFPDVDQALVNINQHLIDRKSIHRMSIPVADQVLLPGTVAEDVVRDLQGTSAGQKIRPSANHLLMKNPSFQQFFNTVSTRSLRLDKRKDVVDDFASLPPAHTETTMRLSFRNFGPIRLFFVGNVEIPLDNKSRHSHLFLHPEAKARRPWNLLMTISIAYFAIVLPLRIAFEAALSSYAGLFAFETFLDSCYLMEIALNFLTVDVNNSHHGRIVYDFRVIAKKYLNSWFIWDFMSIIPLDVVSSSMTNQSAAHFFRFLKLLRMIRVLRLLRLSKYMSDYHSGSRIVKSFVLLIAAAHILSCFWVYLMHFEHEDGALGWSDVYPVPIPTGPSQYLTALYFVVATMGTVGFGDVVALTTAEKVYTTVLMVFSVTMFAYFIGNISSIVSGWGSTDADFKGHIRNLKLFMEKEDLPKDMRSRLLAYHDYCYKRYGTFPFSDPTVTDDLSPALKAEVTAFLNRDLIHHVPVLEGLREDIVKAVLQVLKHEIYGPRDIIMHEGDLGTEMYFLKKGRVLVSWKGATHTNKKVLTEGALFGEMAVLLGFNRTATITALSFCEVSVLTSEMFDKLIINAPDFAAWIRNLVLEQNYRFKKSLQEEIESRWRRFSKIVDDLQLTKFEAIKYNNASVFETSSEDGLGLDSREPISLSSHWRTVKDSVSSRAVTKLSR